MRQRARTESPHDVDGPTVDRPTVAPADLVVMPMRRRHLRAVRAIDAQVYPRPWSMGLYLDELSRPHNRVYLVACDPLAHKTLAADEHDVNRAESKRRKHVPRSHGPVVGYIGMMGVVDEGHITSVAVDPTRHRSQVGARLLWELHRALRTQGCPPSGPIAATTLEVRASNAAAQRLYGRFGYAPVGVRKGYYRDKRARPAEDALVMWCHDIAGEEHGERLARIARELGLRPVEKRP